MGGTHGGLREAFFSNWNTDTYVLIGPDYKPEPPAKGPVLSNQDLKSALELPWGGEVSAERRLIRGRTWSPFGKIAKVEYSLSLARADGEAQGAQHRRRLGRWEFDWESKPGKHADRVRATDAKGEHASPTAVPLQPARHLYNAVVDHPITVT